MSGVGLSRVISQKLPRGIEEKEVLATGLCGAKVLPIASQRPR